ncbi:MAG TPA: 7TM diverse intracellular signaling domain-containing protein, partial [Leptospiraceae bacterium]|nr:7TM diverse intracellular signaling domain-containing protein [Leptospiraceae bacterium]
MRSNTLNLGIFNGDVWLKFKIRNISENSDWLIEFAHPHIRTFEFYEFQEGELSKKGTTGILFPLNSKEIPNKGFLIPVNLNYGEEKEYYFHLQSGTSIIVNLHLWEKNSYIVQASVENFLYGIFLGIMAVMAFYNLFIFLSTGESAYLYYILYIICFTIMQEAKNGFMYVTFLQAYPVISNNIVPLFIPLAVVFSAFFAKKFLKTDTNFTGSETALNILTGGAVLSGTVNFFIPPNFALLSALAAAGFWSIVMFGVSLNALLKKYKPARIFFTAWLFLIAAVFISALNVAGVLNDNFFTLHCMEIGSALEVILLSLALADRINFLKKENELAQK